jgi:hypothetical protein
LAKKLLQEPEFEFVFVENRKEIRTVELKFKIIFLREAGSLSELHMGFGILDLVIPQASAGKLPCRRPSALCIFIWRWRLGCGMQDAGCRMQDGGSTSDEQGRTRIFSERKIVRYTVSYRTPVP